jgi:hypothetical protein
MEKKVNSRDVRDVRDVNDSKNAGVIFHPGVFVGGMGTGAKRAKREDLTSRIRELSWAVFCWKASSFSLKTRGVRLEGAVKKAFTRGFL